EPEEKKLLFYITKEEKNAIDLNDEVVQGFITRIRKNSSHIRIISEVVEQFQDYSFVKSHKSDLYQIVFYKFASEFSKAEKGQFITPIPLIDFLVKIVNPRSNETIIDPTVGIADFLSVSYVNSENQTELKKFDVVLTNPPFGEDRKYEPKTPKDKEIIEMYELWNIARCGNWIDLGLVFLENAYRILEENGRIGIVLSNSLASIDRVVALFDLPPNVFADSGVNTTLVIAYKPKTSELEKLQKENYSIFTKNIKKVGYEIRTSKRVKFFNPLYKVNEQTFEIEQDAEGKPFLDEEFTDTIGEFRR
ncbi:27100_t:CDS:2, partial [Racocetra persica]